MYVSLWQMADDRHPSHTDFFVTTSLRENVSWLLTWTDDNNWQVIFSISKKCHINELNTLCIKLLGIMHCFGMNGNNEIRLNYFLKNYLSQFLSKIREINKMKARMYIAHQIHCSLKAIHNFNLRPIRCL